MTQLINYPVNNIFYKLVKDSKRCIKLCAPYVKKEIIQEIYQNKKENVSIDIISTFNIGNFHKKSSDIDAFKYILENNDKVYNSQLLHAKFYIFDDKSAIVTSANLTNSGFYRNLEYGILLKNSRLINQINNDYDSMCISTDTGKITSYKISEIQTLLENIPESEILENIPEINEIDSILYVDISSLGTDISPWKRFTIEVIEHVGKNEFILSDIYKFKYVFKREYPNNNTIENSIRRNLQELRDLGLLKFLGNGRYLKLWRNIR